MKFGRYGNIMDVYITFKKTKKDSRFGCVRFINIGDFDSFERRWKETTIRDERLVINRAKFIKVDRKGVPISNFY